MTKDEALKLALEFFETMQRYKGVRSNIFIKFEPTATGDYLNLQEFDERAKPIIAAIKQALAAPVQEPVGEVCGYYERGFDAEKTRYGKLYNQDLPLGIKLYTTPPAAPVQEPVGVVQQEPLGFMSEESIANMRAGQTRYAEIYLKGSYEEPIPVYTTPPAAQRQWVGLTDEEIKTQVSYDCTLEDMVRSVEAKLKEKNT